jgi:hypothetical protein
VLKNNITFVGGGVVDGNVVLWLSCSVGFEPSAAQWQDEVDRHCTEAVFLNGRSGDHDPSFFFPPVVFPLKLRKKGALDSEDRRNEQWRLYSVKTKDALQQNMH